MTQDAPTIAPIELTGVLVDRDSWSAAGCPAAAALEIIGTRSALLIMREALYGTSRFDDFAARVGITEAVAAARLRELTEAGLLQKVPYREPGQRTRHEYRLTEMGRDAGSVVFALYEWGAKYLRPDGRAPFEFLHRDCDAPVHVEIVCDDGHRTSIDEMTAHLAVRPVRPGRTRGAAGS